MIIRIVLCCVVLLSLAEQVSSLLKGDEQRCSNEGEQVVGNSIKFITDVDPCIKCFCRKGVVKCEKSTCPSLEGCHMILYKSAKSTSCCQECVGCVEGGIRYKSGDKWQSTTDPCVQKECKAGVITTASAVCPALTCSNPVQIDGQCCPSCPTCEVNNKTYGEGETFRPYPDICVSCNCQDGKASCMKKACPVLNCPDSKVVHPEGECCPRCEGSRTTFLVPRMCLFKHQIYQHGKSHQVNSCTKCSCNEGTMMCTRDACPVLDCAVEDQEVSPLNSCCSVCKPKVQFKECVYKDTPYQHGSSWTDSCVECSCNNGTVTCTKPACDAEQHCPLETHQLKFRPGACCPVCVERDGLCTVFGDPHYVTFDKKIYDFQGTCKYTLAKDCMTKEFAVYVQNFNRYNMPGAWTKSVTILLGPDTKIGLRKNGKVKINKSLVSLPFTTIGEFTVRYEKEKIIVETVKGLKVVWNTESYLELHVPAEYKSKTCGMCGNFNGNPDDDFIGKDKQLHETALEFAMSWQRGRESICEVGFTQEQVQARCQDNFSKWRRAHQECTILKSRALKDCRSKIDVEAYYKSCVTDACNCPRHRKCTCDAVTAYVRECERSGFYNTEAPLDYSCSRQRRRIQQRVVKNLKMVL